MNKQKWILAVLIAASFILALRYSYEFFRLDIIRASLEWDLPGWLQAWLWGW